MIQIARKLPETIEEPEFLATIKKVKNPKHKIAFLLGFYGGLRVSEIVNLKPENIENGFIRIMGKGNKERDVPIPKPLERGLKHLPVGMSRQALHKAMKKYWPEHHMHTLRHSACSYYVSRGMDISQVKALAGHSDIKTTQIYTHVRPEHLKSKFEELF